MALLADANVILEVLLPGRPKAQIVESFLRGKSVCISMLSVHLAYHFGTKEGYGIEQISQFLDGYAILDLTSEDYRVALRTVRGTDFEDALQLAIGLRNGCEAIVTLDQPFAVLYRDTMPFIVPAD